MSALSLGDAIIVAAAGGLGTLAGGTITAVVAYRTKLVESRAYAILERAAARRRQGERQAEISQQLLTALMDLQATVWKIHVARLEGSSIGFPATMAVLEFRASAGHCLLLASRIIVSDIRKQVRETVQECENLLAERTLDGVADSQAQMEKSFELLGSEVAAALSEFEGLAVEL
jgi:hypothetical protein